MRRGYTLIELAVSLAMAAVISTAALSAFAAFNRHRVRIERSTSADDIAKTVVQYLVRESQRIGGSALRPWQAIAVEQEPCATNARGIPCVAGDRVTFAFPDDDAVFPGCSIKNITASSITFENVGHDGRNACCNLFHYDDDGDVDLIQPSELKNEHIMLSSTGFGGTAKEIFKAVTYANSLNADVASCRFDYVESGQAFPLASVKDDGSRPVAGDFKSGSVIEKHGNAIPIKIATAYLGCDAADGDCVNHPEDRALFLFSDRDAGKGTSTDVDRPTASGNGDDNFVVSPNIIDLQVALGYDNDEDGEVVENETGINDDFAGNNFDGQRDTGVSNVVSTDTTTTVSISFGSIGLTLPVDATTVSTNLPPNPRLLRMIRVGVMAAVKVNDPKYISTAQLPGGAVITGRSLHLRALSSKAAFRSLNLLE